MIIKIPRPPESRLLHDALTAVDQLEAFHKKKTITDEEYILTLDHIVSYTLRRLDRAEALEREHKKNPFF